jgi:single-strand DNA-binding protein
MIRVANYRRTTWFRVTAWRRLAETCSQYLAKGRLVMVEGTLSEPKPYQGRDGEWRANLEVRADNVKFLGGRGEGGESGGGAAPAASAGEPAGATGEEDIPF